MQIDATFLTPFLSIVGSGLLGGVAYIMRTLTKQNEALAVLVARVGTYDIGAMNARVIALETDVVRMWKIHDDYVVRQTGNGASSASATETLARIH